MRVVETQLHTVLKEKTMFCTDLLKEEAVISWFLINYGASFVLIQQQEVKQ